ncbi:MAG: class I SAM-dependent methyltransferase [bacterium]|jgi:ubiquinone/menaquinone biosynthesis C-methylase UbiE
MFEQKEKTWDFDQWADNYDGWVTSDDPVYFRYETILERVLSLSGAARGKRVLDIGTGTGNLAGRLLDRGARIVGLDPSQKMLDKARVKLEGRPGIELRRVEDPFLEIPYDDESFDAVVSTYAFHHVHPDKKPECVREMMRVLKPGGTWVIGDLIFQNERDEKAIVRAHDWMEDEYFARIDELLPVFRDMGVKLKSEQYTLVTWVLWATRQPAA